MFALICVYFFSNMAFFFVDDTYYNGDIGAGGERTCTDMLQCFYSTVNYGPRHDPAIGYHLIA